MKPSGAGAASTVIGGDHYQTLSGIETGGVAVSLQASDRGDDHYQTLSGIETPSPGNRLSRLEWLTVNPNG
nr:hypothetical protein [Leptolyngbya ohadii]